MDVSTRVTGHRGFLQYLAKAEPTQLQSLLRAASDSEIKTICELSLNYIEGNLKTIEDLNRRRNFLKTLASKSVPLLQKRDILNNSRVYRSVLQNFIGLLLK